MRKLLSKRMDERRFMTYTPQFIPGSILFVATIWVLAVVFRTAWYQAAHQYKY